MKIQWKVFIGILFFTFSLLAQNNDNPSKSSETPVQAEKHRIYFQTGYGYGNLENANLVKDFNQRKRLQIIKFEWIMLLWATRQRN